MNIPLKQTINDLLTLLESKAQDYGNTIPSVAEALNMPSDTVFRVLIQLKLSRIDNLIKNCNKANYESLADSIQDLCGYALLWCNNQQSLKENKGRNI